MCSSGCLRLLVAAARQLCVRSSSCIFDVCCRCRALTGRHEKMDEDESGANVAQKAAAQMTQPIRGRATRSPLCWVPPGNRKCLPFPINRSSSGLSRRSFYDNSTCSIESIADIVLHADAQNPLVVLRSSSDNLGRAITLKAVNDRNGNQQSALGSLCDFQ